MWDSTGSPNSKPSQFMWSDLAVHLLRQFFSSCGVFLSITWRTHIKEGENLLLNNWKVFKYHDAGIIRYFLWQHTFPGRNSRSLFHKYLFGNCYVLSNMDGEDIKLKGTFFSLTITQMKSIFKDLHLFNKYLWNILRENFQLFWGIW